MNPVKNNQAGKSPRTDPGFTLIELMIAMLVATLAMGGIYSVYISTTQSYDHQRELAHMQQNLRAAMLMIKNDIRNAGREPDPPMRNPLGIMDVRRWNPDADDPVGYPGITMDTFIDTDIPPDGELDNTVRRIAYRVFDSDGDGRRELRRWDSLNPGWQLVFDGIEDIGFAYAYDLQNDFDLALERSVVAVGAGTVIWAVDATNNNRLDTNADNVGDGNIDALDDTDGDGDIDQVDGGLGAQIDLSNIRAVRIFLLARSRFIDPDYVDTAAYTLGHKVLDLTNPVNANRRNFRHRMLVSAVTLNNHRRNP